MDRWFQITLTISEGSLGGVLGTAFRQKTSASAGI
jgi:hypothetical protein